MSIMTSQQLTRYYDSFRSVDITFTKEIIKATGLKSKQVYLKCLGSQWPCLIYSSSLASAKVIINTKSGIHEHIRNANNIVQLRYSFVQNEKNTPLSFFVGAKVAGFQPYGKDNPDLSFLNINFTQRPPDSLIEIIGNLLDASIAAQKRKEERIILTPDTIRKLRIKGKNTNVNIQGVPRKCIIRDLSFSGAKLIIMGVAKFLVDKEAILTIDFEDPDEQINLNGKVIRFEVVEGRKDIAAFAIQFHEKFIPMSYKMRINDYLKQVKTKPTKQ